MTDFLLGHCWPLLASVAVKSLCILALAGVAALALRRSPAAARHLAWRLALAGLLFLPLLSSLPAVWQIPLTPRALLVTPDAPIVTPDPSPHPPAAGGPREAGRWVPSPPELGAGGRSGAGRATPSAPPLPWPLWALGLWLIGFVLTLLPFLIGLAGVGGLARRSPPVSDGPLQDLAASLARSFGVSPPRLLTGEAGTPMTWGWRRPVILLPAGADAWPEDRLRAVLLHELAHVARGDWPAQMAAHLACALYWYNPAVWLAARQARLESERACDDRVLLAGIPAPDYARHLLDVARALNTQTLPAALPMVRTLQIESRLREILQPKRRKTMPTRKTITVAALATVAIIAPLAALRPVAQAGPVLPAEVNALPSPLTGGQTLHSSVKVQLAGLTSERSGDRAFAKPWWGPTGKVLPRPLLPKIMPTSMRVGRGQEQRALAFKITSPDGQPVTLEFRPASSLGMSSDGSWPGKVGGGAPATETQIDAYTGGYRVLYTAYPVGATRDDIRVGIGAGPWKTAASDVNFAYGSISAFSSTRTYAFSPVTKTADGSVVTVSVSVDEDPQHPSSDLRVVAVDRAGHERLPVAIGDNSAGMLDQINARFDLPLTAIKSVRLESRPFHWMTFRNVPLQPRL